MVEDQVKVKRSYSDHYYEIAKNYKVFYSNLKDLIKNNKTIMLD